MKIVYGTDVEDKKGNKVGQVNHVIRDTWTGAVRKFGVWQDSDNKAVMFSPDDIENITEEKIVLGLDLESKE